MATQKHFNRECESGLLFEDQCSPHVFLIDCKVSACHVFVLLVHALAAIYADSLPFATIENKLVILGIEPHLIRYGSPR
jgi:hypothetical protein